MQVTPYSYTPASDSGSAQATIVIEGPVATSSNAAQFSLSCDNPDITVSPYASSPSSPQQVACDPSAGRQAFTVATGITSDVATTITVQWQRSDGSTSEQAVPVSPTPTLVQDTVTVPSGNPDADTLVVMSQANVTYPAGPISLQATCSHPSLQIAMSLPDSSKPCQDAYAAACYTCPLANGEAACAIDFTATGGSGSPANYNWSISWPASGEPTGASFNEQSDGTGVFSWTYSGSDSATVTVHVWDSQSHQEAETNVTLEIEQQSCDSRSPMSFCRAYSQILINPTSRPSENAQ
jgi:hypothetical protein